MPSNLQHSSSQGFTLIEVVMVIVMFGIGVVLLSSLFTNMQITQRAAMYQNIATQAARSEIEDIRNSEFYTIKNGDSFTSKLPATLPEGRQGVVAVSTPPNAPDAMKVDVTVSYPTGTIMKTVVITAYIDAPEKTP